MEFQLPLLERPEIEAAIATVAEAEADFRGAIFTRREVVDFILDLAGYTSDKPLYEFRILEPSMGGGDFLFPIIDRLFEAYNGYRSSRAASNAVDRLGDCIVGVEVHRETFEKTHASVLQYLQSKGLNAKQANALCKRWLRQGDFLLLPLDRNFTHVVGNPPYIRQELIPDVLMAEYRRRYCTIYDRADIYVPFIEQSLSLLASHGNLAFICADRWMKNRYGGPLRRLITEKYHLKHFVDMVDTAAFHSDVIAYPAIVVIGQEKPAATRISLRPTVEATNLRTLAKAMTARKLGKDPRVTEIQHVAVGAEPWMLTAPDQLELVRRLEAEYPTVEEAGCKVGIGVATGADQVFIASFDALDVEPDRKLPLVMTRDILSGSVQWRGLGVINPFGPDGKLVPLSKYPKLARYLDQHGAAIKARHVSKKNPQGWYRTIDRIYPELVSVPKLLIPDIKGAAHIVYEPGKLYPHHNLYFITATQWDLHALQAVLLSDVTRAFITLYSTKMRGGYLRFQAQYLRRLRLPHWGDVPAALRKSLIKAGRSRDASACNAATELLYNLTAKERKALAADHDANVA
ncbi:Eco57I restriction-modification methylase domain-containing protein [Bradyrhizobium sp. UNPA324]|uniref:Eco57I restriction-modification methylase domain-containing protein n=1 Tax=Bradyrhizobium sp. UNPA324 TaxID=1141174 RepID=UPI001151B8F0|nr:Eco57I restriction-modification methylase domain-containing protein [Bradyrhizobium sp. UNPA324]TQF29153.1 modification methylase PaeR7I [Bradyrhizobium sp. UNPA324]